MENLPFIQAQKKSDGALNRVDPRLKLLAFGLLLVLIGIGINIWSYAVLTAVLLAWLISLRLRPATVRHLAWPLLLMLTLTLLLHLLFGDRGGAEITGILGISVTEQALAAGLLSCWRIILFVLAALCFTFSVTPDEFAAGVWRLLAPLQKLGVPVDNIGLTIFIAIRFIPEIFIQYRQIALAQKIRGAVISGGLIARTRKLIPLLVPVTVAVFRRSNTLADCLVVRGWGVAQRRSYYGRTGLALGDYCFAATLLVILVTVVLVRP